MNGFEIAFILLLGFALGWAVAPKRRRQISAKAVPEQFVKGLNYLLNEQSDRGLEVLIHSVEVNADTLELYLSLGALYRRRGEIGRAIKVHESLLTNTVMPAEVYAEVELALARDYFAAGLLDRSEEILVRLSGGQSGAINKVNAQDQDSLARGEGGRSSALKTVRHQSLSLLLKLYEQEKEWEQAIGVGDDLQPFEGGRIKVALAHYRCELAQIHLERFEQAKAIQASGTVANSPLLLDTFETIRGLLKQALWLDRNCVRSSLLLGKLYYLWGVQLSHLDAEGVNVNSYLSSSQMIDSCQAFEQSLCVFVEVSEKEPLYSSGFLELMHDCYQALKNSNQSPNPAITALLINYRIVREKLLSVKHTVATYRCQNCGFDGKLMHWRCPSCKYWGSIKPDRSSNAPLGL